MSSSSPPPNLRILSTTLSSPEGQHLSSLQRAEILLTNPALPPFAADLPIFLILLSPSNEPIACGGLRPLTDTVAEMKRVYVIPEARGKGKGVADFLVREIEKAALKEGYREMWLQTGVEMTVANRFYERCGYEVREGNYGEYVGDEGTISYGRVLQMEEGKTE